MHSILSMIIRKTTTRMKQLQIAENLANKLDNRKQSKRKKHSNLL